MVHGNWVVENLGKLVDTGLLRLTATVGEEDVRNLDAELVVAVQDLEGTLTLWNESVTVNQDTIDVEDKGHVLGGANSLTTEILHLRGKDLAGWLDWWHTRACLLAIGVGDGREARLALGARNWEGSTKGVARSTAVLE